MHVLTYITDYARMHARTRTHFLSQVSEEIKVEGVHIYLS